MEKSKLPKIYLALKIIGIVLGLTGIALLIIGLTKKTPSMAEDGWFEANAERGQLIFGGVSCFFIGLFLTISGFFPTMAKIQIKTKKHIMDTNSEDLKDIVDTGTDIVEGGVKKIVKSIKDADQIKYCSNCGKKIEKTANFCQYCGSKQKE